tara:strand:- start:19 stop:276 length:258 start_codon:yes stop_codon:yes gene_type:complete
MPKAYVNGTLVDVTQESVDSTKHTLPPTEKQIRNQRNRLISKTDWMAVTDRDMSEAETNYRQALRDITSQKDFPDVIWPTLEESP